MGIAYSLLVILFFFSNLFFLVLESRVDIYNMAYVDIEGKKGEIFF